MPKVNSEARALVLIGSLITLCVAVLPANSYGGEPSGESGGEPSGETVQLTDETVVRFANEREAAAAFRNVDRFTQSLSPFDLQSRLDRTDVSVDAFVEFSANQTVAWTDDQIGQLTPVIQSLGKKLARFALPLPDTVLLVQTTGKVEGNAAYCRGNAIMLPSRFIEARPGALEPLLAHELFHILSGHNPELRYRLYRVIGFHGCAPVELPADLMARKITNPDAPQLDCVLQIDIDGEMVPATPFLWAKAEYEPGKGKSFFDYLQFRLLVLEPTKAGFRPRYRDEKPWFVSAERADFYWNIGRNTRYIIHPEEVLADNFKALVMETPDLPTPRIPAAMVREFGRE